MKDLKKVPSAPTLRNSSCPTFLHIKTTFISFEPSFSLFPGRTFLRISSRPFLSPKLQRWQALTSATRNQVGLNLTVSGNGTEQKPTAGEEGDIGADECSGHSAVTKTCSLSFLGAELEHISQPLRFMLLSGLRFP